MKKIETFLLTAGFKPKQPTASFKMWFESASGDDWIIVFYSGREYKAEFIKFYTKSIVRTSKYSATKATDIIAWIQAQ